MCKVEEVPNKIILKDLISITSVQMRMLVEYPEWNAEISKIRILADRIKVKRND